MRILILEDDPDVSAFLEEALTKTGHEPTSYGHAGLALGAIARGRFELLLCDIMLPNVSGIDTMRMARSQWPYLPIICVSALEEDEWAPTALEAGASCFIPKPIRLERLLSEIELVTRSRANLTIGIVDTDSIHLEQVSQDLVAMGCEVRAFDELAELMKADELHDSINILIMDGALAHINDAFTWAKARDLAAVAFGENMNEDELMRFGAAFCMVKPVDTQALVTQARFFVAPAASGFGF